MSAWRAAGITYIQYSNIAAKAVRACLTDKTAVEAAAKRAITNIKFQRWEAGKPIGVKQ